jgi:hypothetical protein
MTTDISAMTSRQRLRAFEDRVLPDVPRIAGKIELGSGSRYSALRDPDKRHHEALLALIDAEAALDRANAAASAAQDTVTAAQALVEKTAATTTQILTVTEA